MKAIRNFYPNKNNNKVRDIISNFKFLISNINKLNNPINYLKEIFKKHLSKHLFFFSLFKFLISSLSFISNSI